MQIPEKLSKFAAQLLLIKGEQDKRRIPHALNSVSLIKLISANYQQNRHSGTLGGIPAYLAHAAERLRFKRACLRLRLSRALRIRNKGRRANMPGVIIPFLSPFLRMRSICPGL